MKIQIDRNGKTIPTDDSWQFGIGNDHAGQMLRADVCEHVKLAHDELGIRYIRFHGIFDDDLLVIQRLTDYFNFAAMPWAGKVQELSFRQIANVFDNVLKCGMKPFVELSFMPSAIAKGKKVGLRYRNHIDMPKHMARWCDLVEKFIRFLLERYGKEEVESWYFEVWNEPNLNLNPKAGFFDGTKSDYFRMYKESAKAIKSVDERLKVGGPATSNFIADNRHDGEIMDHKKSVFYSQDIINTKQWKGVWIEDFLRFCEKENLPVDFISTHPYPTDYALDPDTGRSKDAIRYVHSLHDDITWLRQQIAGSKYPDAEIHLTEWSTSPNSRDRMHDVLPPAAYILKTNLDCLGMANSLMYWTFTDVFEEKGGGEEIFHGGFGMINFQGLVKPSFHAYRMLHQLGDEKLYYKDPLFVSRSSRTGKISAVAFNYPSEYEEAVPSAANFNSYMQASSKKVDIALKGLKPGTAFEIEILDKDHGNVYDDYLKIGAPHSPGYKEIDYLKQAAWNTDKQIIKVNSEGTFVWKSELAPWSCVLIREL